MNEENEIRWDFPASNYSDVHGFDTGELETFKKDPIASLARESVQNSIDAKRAGSQTPVFVEFVSTEIEVSDIPGIAEIREQLNLCKKKMLGNDKNIARIEKMESILAEGKTRILRISDHQTTGLTGIVSGDSNDRWSSLIKGSGTSTKVSGSLGSKGIGKYSSFVCSGLQMVFYSSKNMKNEVGYEGICRLCAASIPNSSDYTQGPGYFALGSEHKAILSNLEKAWALNRQDNDFGTDLYIVAFVEEEDWKKEVVSNVLDSFVVAIAKKELVIKINETTISSDNLAAIITSPGWVDQERRDSILSQFDCLGEDDSVKTEPVMLEDFPDEAILSIKKYAPDSEEEKHATKCCTLVRYPYMRIKDYTNISILPCSALLILKNGKLADMLRDIENPQHNDWEPKRIEDPSKRKYVQSVIKEMKKKIIEMIIDFLGKSGTSISDFDGAGQYLPDSGEGGGKRKSKDESDNTSISKEKQASVTTSEGYTPSENAETIVPDIGGIDESADGPISYPNGNNNGKGGGRRPGEGDGGETDGDDVIFKRIGQTGMHWRFFCQDKDKGLYCVFVVAPSDEQNCRLSIVSFDDSGMKTKVDVKSCILEGKPLACNGNTVKGFSFEKGKSYRFTLALETNEYFSGRAEFYASRK